MLIHDLLTQKGNTNVLSIKPDESLLAMAAILAKKKIGCLPVVDEDGKLVGIVSERDLVRAVTEFPNEIAKRHVKDIMTKNVITCTTKDDVTEIQNMMNRHGFRHMPVMNGDKLITVVSIRDFQMVCDHFQMLASTDSLTGLPNRRYFMDILAGEFSRYKRMKAIFSLAVLDLDHFKIINDTYGHEAGDRVLGKMAEIFERRLRGYDVVGRIGGEEFAILFPSTELEGAICACRHLARAIQESQVESEAGSIRFTASIGVTEVRRTQNDASELINVADKLLYRAKAAGRNTIISDMMENPDALNTWQGQIGLPGDRRRYG